MDDAARNEIADLKAKQPRLTPADLLLQARSSNSALHRFFDWNDSTAAQAYRMQQANQLLRVYVRYTAPPKPRVTKVMIETKAPATVVPIRPAVRTGKQDRVAAFWNELTALIARYESEPLLRDDMLLLKGMTADDQTRRRAPQKRQCLSCERSFVSSGPGERMCNDCRRAA